MHFSRCRENIWEWTAGDPASDHEETTKKSVLFFHTPDTEGRSF